MGTVTYVEGERQRLRAELESIVRHGTHANHKYQVCGVCMAERALGLEVDERYVRNLPKSKTLGVKK